VFVARAFLDGHWKFTGTDQIPGGKKGCQAYDDDFTYGADLIPGPYASAKVSVGVKALARLKAGRKGVSAKVGLGMNTDYPPPVTCDAVFGAPDSCALRSEKLSGTFLVNKVR
jgi:hypothetical protein